MRAFRGRWGWLRAAPAGVVVLWGFVLAKGRVEHASQAFSQWMGGLNVGSGWLVVSWLVVVPALLVKVGTPGQRVWRGLIASTFLLILPLVVIGLVQNLAISPGPSADFSGRSQGEWERLTVDNAGDVMHLTGVLGAAGLSLSMLVLGMTMASLRFMRPLYAMALVAGILLAWSVMTHNLERDRAETSLDPSNNGLATLRTGLLWTLTCDRAIGLRFDPFLYDPDAPGQNPGFWGRTQYHDAVEAIAIAHAILLAAGFLTLAVARWGGPASPQSHSASMRARES